MRSFAVSIIDGRSLSSPSRSYAVVTGTAPSGYQFGTGTGTMWPITGLVTQPQQSTITAEPWE